MGMSVEELIIDICMFIVLCILCFLCGVVGYVLGRKNALLDVHDVKGSMQKDMGMTLEYFLTKRITILKAMLERLPDDSEFNRGVRAAYRDELFVCENILDKKESEIEDGKV